MICDACYLRMPYRRCGDASLFKRRPEPDERFYGPKCADVVKPGGTCPKFWLNQVIRDGMAPDIAERIERAAR